MTIPSPRGGIRAPFIQVQASGVLEVGTEGQEGLHGEELGVLERVVEVDASGVEGGRGGEVGCSPSPPDAEPEEVRR